MGLANCTLNAFLWRKTDGPGHFTTASRTTTRVSDTINLRKGRVRSIKGVEGRERLELLRQHHTSMGVRPAAIGSARPGSFCEWKCVSCWYIGT